MFKIKIRSDKTERKKKEKKWKQRKSSANQMEDPADPGTQLCAEATVIILK